MLDDYQDELVLGVFDCKELASSLCFWTLILFINSNMSSFFSFRKRFKEVYKYLKRAQSNTHASKYWWKITPKENKPETSNRTSSEGGSQGDSEDTKPVRKKGRCPGQVWYLSLDITITTNLPNTYSLTSFSWQNHRILSSDKVLLKPQNKTFPSLVEWVTTSSSPTITSLYAIVNLAKLKG